MDDTMKLVFEQIESRLKNVEDKVSGLEKHVNQNDITEAQILESLKHINEKLDEVVAKQNKLLNNPTPVQALNEDKAEKWNKIISTIITVVVTAVVTAIIANIK